MSGPEIPERIRSLTPYKPGRPIEEVERELGISGSIKIASNENPLGPSPMALAAVAQALPNIHRYPDGGAVIDTATKQIVSRIPTSEKLVEVDFAGSEPIEAGQR